MLKYFLLSLKYLFISSFIFGIVNIFADFDFMYNKYKIENKTYKERNFSVKNTRGEIGYYKAVAFDYRNYENDIISVNLPPEELYISIGETFYTGPYINGRFTGESVDDEFIFRTNYNYEVINKIKLYEGLKHGYFKNKICNNFLFIFFGFFGYVLMLIIIINEADCGLSKFCAKSCPFKIYCSKYKVNIHYKDVFKKKAIFKGYDEKTVDEFLAFASKQNINTYNSNYQYSFRNLADFIKDKEHETD